MDYNDRMQAEIDAERAENINVPWWERSPWGAKSEAFFLLKKIEAFKEDYDATQNPLFVWAALREIAALSLEEPGQEEAAQRWIQDYLSASAERLMKLITEPPTTDVSDHIAGCFGFEVNRGRGSPFSSVAKLIRDRKLAFEVGRRLPIERYKETLAIEYVASKNDCGVSIVREAWAGFKRDFGKFPNSPK